MWKYLNNISSIGNLQATHINQIKQKNQIIVSSCFRSWMLYFETQFNMRIKTNKK